MTTELNAAQLETALKSFRDDVVKEIGTAKDASAKEISELKAKLEVAETGIKTLEEQAKKGFGLAGCETEAKDFRWSKFFRGLVLNFDASKGKVSHSEAKRFWDGEASLEAALCREYGKTVAKDYEATDGSSGGFIVPPQVYQGDIVDTVYANTAVLKMPCLKLTGLRSDVPIPTDNGNLTSYDLGENEKPTKTSSSFGLKWLRPKKFGTFVKISNRLLYQSNEAIAAIVKNKMALDAAVHLSARLTTGSGSDSQGKGIMAFYGDMTDTKLLSTNGARFTIDDLASMKQSLAVANELQDKPTYGAMMHPSVEWGMLRQKVKQYSGQASKDAALLLPSIILDKASIENPLKMRIESTTQVSATETAGTSSTTSKVIFGDWSKFVYASFRDPIFRVSDVAGDGSTGSALLDDELYMVMFMEYDSMLLRPTAFTGRSGAETAEANW